MADTRTAGKRAMAWWRWWTEGDPRLETLYPPPVVPQRHTIPARVRIEVLVRDGPFCRHCGQRVTMQTLEFDHFPVPVIRGGTNDASNIVVACRRCNRSLRDHGRLELIDG